MLLKQKSLLVSSIALTIAGGVILAKPSIPSNSFSFAQTPMPTPIQFQERSWEKGKMLEQLNLSNLQKQQLGEIHQQFHQQVNTLKENMQTEQMTLRTMMVGTESEASIRAKYQELVDLRQDFDQLRFDSMLAMREVLTPQQRNQFAQIMQQHRQQFPHHFRDRFD